MQPTKVCDSIVVHWNHVFSLGFALGINSLLVPVLQGSLGISNAASYLIIAATFIPFLISVILPDSPSRLSVTRRRCRCRLSSSQQHSISSSFLPMRRVFLCSCLHLCKWCCQCLSSGICQPLHHHPGSIG